MNKIYHLLNKIHEIVNVTITLSILASNQGMDSLFLRILGWASASLVNSPLLLAMLFT